MKESISLSGALAGVLLDFLNAEQLPAPACRARLSAWQPDDRISQSEWASCLLMISREYPRPALGLEIARHMQPHHAGMLGYLLLSCDSFGEFLKHLECYYSLMWQGYPMFITRSETVVTIHWVLPQGLKAVVPLGYEVGVAAIVHILRMLCGNALNPSTTTLLGPKPADISSHERFFKCPVVFAPDRAALSFPLGLLTLPIQTEKASLRALVERLAQAQLQSAIQRDEFLDVFQKALVRSLKKGSPTIECVGDDMGISSATLKRKLREKGIAFQRVLDATRLDMAKMYLDSHRLSLAEIASLLAFSEQSAFCRSFKRWTGKTPQEYRRS